ncbi:MAG: hypothetical protein H0Z28_12180 [Archaeoglobus sp.]|nr:hypothetical protein [Archaeoglobus sp.]
MFSKVGHSYEDRATEGYLYSLQNFDGGFRRSLYTGISTLENTYYSVKVLHYLGALNQE